MNPLNDYTQAELERFAGSIKKGDRVTVFFHGTPDWTARQGLVDRVSSVMCEAQVGDSDYRFRLLNEYLSAFWANGRKLTAGHGVIVIRPFGDREIAFMQEQQRLIQEKLNEDERNRIAAEALNERQVAALMPLFREAFARATISPNGWHFIKMNSLLSGVWDFLPESLARQIETKQKELHEWKPN